MKRSLFLLSSFALWLMASVAFDGPFAHASQLTNSAAQADVCRRSFSIDDYFQTGAIVQLAISDSGDWVEYVSERRSLRENKNIREFYSLSLAPGAKPVAIGKLNDAQSITWIPHSYRFAYLSGKSGITQIYSYDVRDNSVRQLTDSSAPVTQFRFAPDGVRFAFATFVKDPVPTLGALLQESKSGIVADTDTAGLEAFIRPSLGGWPAGAHDSQKLWLASTGGNVSPVEVPGTVADFSWSSDSTLLSVRYQPFALGRSLEVLGFTSLGLVDVATQTLRPLFEAQSRRGEVSGVSFAGGEWIPGQRLLSVERVVHSTMGVSEFFPDWAIVSPTDRANGEPKWRSGEAFRPHVFPLSSNVAWTENTANGVRSLFEWKGAEVSPAPPVANLGGDNTLFSFSADRHAAAFVHQSLSRPPEIYLWRSGQPPTSISQINLSVNKLCGPKIRRITWNSSDGEQASGWLFEPRSGGRGPWPLLTYVHGGPSSPVTDEFNSIFSVWAYPLEVYPAYGIAVFIPNYRGTQTFGRKFSTPKFVDQEPVDDVSSGIRSLIAAGIADPDRLAISGHSHGSFLGPMVLTKERDLKFKATSFAEGFPDSILLYEEFGGAFNRGTHESRLFSGGVSLYDDPRRYLELSPLLHLNGLNSANLLESGTEVSPLQMLAFGKASRRAGMATETILYPRTGHDLTSPLLEKESAERNLDWFRFWLKGEEDPDPAKVPQYLRWRELRERNRAS